jgi:hypothetical protein
VGYYPELLALNDYYPFGMLMPDRNPAAGNGYRFGFNGQEKTDEVYGKGNLNTALFWEYDTRLGRRWNQDPKPNPSISNYAAFANNPIWFTDVLGDTAAVFKPDGTFWKMQDDGKAEWSILHYTTSKEVEHKVKGVSTTYVVYSNPNTYQFADPVADPQAIKDGTINKLVFVDVSKVGGMLGKAGAFDPTNRENEWSYMNTESKGGGKLDFSYSSIPFEFPAASSDPLNTPSSMLLIAQGDNYAHNHMNFGNFLWGAAGHSLGFSETSLKGAAHYNSLFNSSTNGYKPQWDSSDDQLSISRGVNFSKINQFRDRTWSPSTGLSPAPKKR